MAISIRKKGVARLVGRRSVRSFFHETNVLLRSIMFSYLTDPEKNKTVAALVRLRGVIWPAASVDCASLIPDHWMGRVAAGRLPGEEALERESDGILSG